MIVAFMMLAQVATADVSDAAKRVSPPPPPADCAQKGLPCMSIPVSPAPPLDCANPDVACGRVLLPPVGEGRSVSDGFYIRYVRGKVAENLRTQGYPTVRSVAPDDAWDVKITVAISNEGATETQAQFSGRLSRGRQRKLAMTLKELGRLLPPPPGMKMPIVTHLVLTK